MSPRFLLDGMLGSLTRWLRISGYDSEYRRDTDDNDLIQEADREGRILVTRDKELFQRAKKRDVVAILVESDKDAEQLSEVARKIGLVLEPRESRCPKCNGLLVQKEKFLIKGKVPASSLEAFNEFWVCESCGSVYWKGSHWNQIRLTIENAREAE
jgi:uncharacterized protein with PIN domain